MTAGETSDLDELMMSALKAMTVHFSSAFERPRRDLTLLMSALLLHVTCERGAPPSQVAARAGEMKLSHLGDVVGKVRELRREARDFDMAVSLVIEETPRFKRPEKKRRKP